MNWRIGVFGRLIAASLCATALTMVLAWSVATYFMARAFESGAVERLRAAVALVADAALPPTAEVLRRVARLQDADLYAFDADARVLASSGGPPRAEVAAGMQAFVLSGADAGDTRTNDGRIVVLRRLHASATAPGGLAAVAHDAESVRATRRAAWTLALVMAAALPAVALLLHVLVRRITAPIAQLADAADEIAGGRRDVHVHYAHPDALGTLAQALATMARRLDGYERDLEARARSVARGELAARVAHEIRNPLTAIKMHLQLLRESAAGAQAGVLDRLLDETRRLELVAEAALLLGADRALVRARVPPDAVLREVAELLAPLLAHRRVAFEVDAPALPPADIDRAKIKQVLLNLVLNAADAVGEGGRVRASVACEREVLRYVVEDSGPGLDPGKIDALRAGGRSTKAFGLGLGLPIAMDIVERHGGRLRIERSSALGGARLVAEIDSTTSTVKPVPGA